MQGHRLAIRILGVSPTSHGFAFVVSERPDQLLDWARHRTGERRTLRIRLDHVVSESRPLFVACEIERNRCSRRGREFNGALRGVCARYGIMILCVERRLVWTAGRGDRPATDYQIARVAADRFPEIADKLPKPRRAWNGSDDRIGVLLAAELARAGWSHFRRPH